jgi:hypothetical protein
MYTNKRTLEKKIVLQQAGRKLLQFFSPKSPHKTGMPV